MQRLDGRSRGRKLTSIDLPCMLSDKGSDRDSGKL